MLQTRKARNMQKPCQGLSHTHQMATDIHLTREWKPRVAQNTFGTTQHTVRARLGSNAVRFSFLAERQKAKRSCCRGPKTTTTRCCGMDYEQGS